MFRPVRQVGRHADAFWASQWLTSNAFRMGSYHKLAIGYFAVTESFRSLDNNSKADCAKMNALEHRAIVIVNDFIRLESGFFLLGPPLVASRPAGGNQLNFFYPL